MSAAPDMDDVIELFLAQHRAGTAPDLYTFAARYPKLRAKLERLLPLILQMEGYADETLPKLDPADEQFPDLGNADYQLVRRIGSGGMGVVYEAQQLSLHRKVALKVLATSSVADPQHRALFKQEAHVIARLHHPNIVKIFSADTTSTRCYYAMELIQGKGVDHAPCDDLRKIAAIGLQTAKALAYAHSCNILHRDIKPANLLLDAEGNVHVSDFGLAFVLQTPTEQQRDGEELRYGTLRYMAPERIAQGINTFAGDQYALGVTLYEMVAQRPILTTTPPQALRERITSSPLPPLTCAEPDLAAIINKCVAFRPEDRYASMEAVAADLQRFLEHRVVSAARTSLFRRFRLWHRRNPVVAGLTFAGVMLFFAFVVALVVGYLRVNAARKLAEQNAAHANATLVDIFYHIEHQSPTTAGTELLARLMPYYQAIAQQQKAPSEQLINANQIVGTAALRSGNYAIAETAFRNLIALQPDVTALRQLGDALLHQGKTDDAHAIFSKVIENYPTSSEAIYALQVLERYQEAFDLLHQQLRLHPDDPDLRFLYAQLLGRYAPAQHPQQPLTINPQATILLNELVEEFPDRPEYAIALMETMNRKLRHARQLSTEEQEELTLALTASSRLLGRFPNTPGVVNSVIDLHRAYVLYLHRNRQRPTARKEIERLQGMLEVLSHNPEVSDSVKELLRELKDEPSTRPIPPSGEKAPDLFRVRPPRPTTDAPPIAPHARRRPRAEKRAP